MEGRKRVKGRQEGSLLSVAMVVYAHLICSAILFGNVVIQAGQRGQRCGTLAISMQPVVADRIWTWVTLQYLYLQPSCHM